MTAADPLKVVANPVPGSARWDALVALPWGCLSARVPDESE